MSLFDAADIPIDQETIARGERQAAELEHAAKMTRDNVCQDLEPDNGIDAWYEEVEGS